MPFPPPKAGKKMFDDPMDELMGSTEQEPDGDESYIDDVMGQDLEGGDEELFKESPLESALGKAGFNATPEQLSQIEQILAKKPGKPGAGAPTGGAVPEGIEGSDLNI
jgi:hypothetical protein